MPVELRVRRSRPSYAAMLELPDDEAGAVPEHDEDLSSESAFEPPEAENEKDDDNDEGDVAVEPDQSELEELAGGGNTNVVGAAASGSKRKAKAKATKAPSRATRASTAAPRAPAVMPSPGLPKPKNTRQAHARSLQSVYHRHRGKPIHNTPLRTFRLFRGPRLFTHTDTIETRSASDPLVKDRLARAHRNNFGPGPLWELMEDRSWYKECAPNDQTRPIVYESLRVHESWTVLTSEDSLPYLPRNIEEGSGNSRPFVCYFGPYGNQQKTELSIFDTVKMSNFFPEAKSHVFYAGAPVWAIDWCPVFLDDLPRRNYKQYVAVAPFPSNIYNCAIGRRAIRPSPACIQIWSLSPTPPQTADSSEKNGNMADDLGVMACEMVLCMDGGPVQDMKWCPLPAHDKYGEHETSLATRKLGVLAGTFEDGSLSIYVVPEPQSLPPQEGKTSSPIFIKLEPHIRVELVDTCCWSLDWANSDLLAVGCTNGSVAIFHVKDALSTSNGSTPKVLRPSHYIPLHQSAIRAVCWARAPPAGGPGVVRLDRDPTVIVTGGYDGAEIVTDIRDQRGNIMNRTRDAINSMAHSHHLGGPLAPDNENILKNYTLTPTMLGKGHVLLETSGPIWTISTSDFHPQVAVGSADGSCQTTNALRSIRKGGTVPHFIHKIFQLDYSRNSKEFRMLERFLPHEHQDRPSITGASKKKKKSASEADQESTTITGAWSPEISVTRVAWNSGSGLAHAPLLASATASGLCRIDWLLGRIAENVPFKTIEYLRGEIGEDDNEDEDVEMDELDDA